MICAFFSFAKIKVPKMKNTRTTSNDECVAGIHRFIAGVASILYSLKGDLGSFLVQAQDLSLSGVEARYALHIKDNMPEALDKLSRSSATAQRLILRSNNPELIKIKWLKCIALYEDAFKNFSGHQIHSEVQDYTNAAENLLKIVNSFQELTESFSTSVELVTVSQDLDRGLRHLRNVERAFSKAFRLAQEHSLIKKLTSEERKQLHNQLINITDNLK